MELSKRLQTVASAVTPGNRLADVGTDHGYVPIYLVQEGICPSAVAMDVNKGPLDRANEHITEEGMAGRIETRLSDGLIKLRPEETDTVVIAGMGGDLICRILGNALPFLEAGKELVLQPQSEWFKVRHFLHEHEYCIEQEWFLKEDGKYYVIIRALPANGQPVSYENEAEYRYGSLLLAEKHPVLLEYLTREQEKKKNILENLQQTAGQSRQQERCQQLKEELKEIEEILSK